MTRKSGPREEEEARGSKLNNINNINNQSQSNNFIRRNVSYFIGKLVATLTFCGPHASQVLDFAIG